VIVEEYLNMPLHQGAEGWVATGDDRKPIRVHGAERVTLYGKWIGAYNNSAGIFDGERAIFVEYRLTPPGDPAVVLHELSHFWFHDRSRLAKDQTLTSGVPWFNEGVCSMLPWVALNLSHEESRAIRVHWGLTPSSANASDFEDDLPIGH